MSNSEASPQNVNGRNGEDEEQEVGEDSLEKLLLQKSLLEKALANADAGSVGSADATGEVLAEKSMNEDKDDKKGSRSHHHHSESGKHKKRHSRSPTKKRSRSRSPRRSRSRSKSPRRRSRSPTTRSSPRRRSRSRSPRRKSRSRSPHSPRRRARSRSRSPRRRSRSPTSRRRSRSPTSRRRSPSPRRRSRSPRRDNSRYGKDSDRNGSRTTRDSDRDHKSHKHKEEERAPPPESDEEVVELQEPQSDNEEELIEAARRKRQAILEKYRASATGTPMESPAPSSPPTPHPTTTTSQPTRTTTTHPSNTTTQPTHTTTTTSQPTHTTQLAHKGSRLALVQSAEHAEVTPPPIETYGSADMFSDEFTVPEPVPRVEGEEAAPHNTQFDHLTDNWDDEEGYYKLKIGEVLDGRYEVFGYTGQGVFSNVVRARDQQNSGALVAIKIIRNNDVMYRAALKELEILRALDKADPQGRFHCVRLLRNFTHCSHLCLVFEHFSMNLRELQKKFGRNDGLSLQAVHSFAQQLLYSLRLLQKCNVLHGDLKPDNILVNDAKTLVKLCDFGSASMGEEATVTPYLVSRFYRAPEIMLGMKYSFGIDMWSLACSLFEAYTGRILFPGRDNNHMLKVILEIRGKPANKFLRRGAFKDHHFDENLNFLSKETDRVTQAVKVVPIALFPGQDLMNLLTVSERVEPLKKKLAQFKDLLERMLQIDPERRISPSEALRHPFITEPCVE